MKQRLSIVAWCGLLFLTIAQATPESNEQAGMTAAHNSVRHALNINELSWSEALANHAQEWADYLANNNQCKMQHRPDDGAFKRLYGENLFWASPRRWSSGKVEIQDIKAEDVVTAWADEVHDYDYANNQCAIGKICGHYTQIVWRNTTAVGCGMKVCSDYSQIWVCSYDPAGNYIGQKPY